MFLTACASTFSFKHRTMDFIASDSVFLLEVTATARRLVQLLERATGVSSASIASCHNHVETTARRTSSSRRSPRILLRGGNSDSSQFTRLRTSPGHTCRQLHLQHVSAQKELREAMCAVEAAAVTAAAELESRGASLREACAVMSSIASRCGSEREQPPQQQDDDKEFASPTAIYHLTPKNMRSSQLPTSTSDHEVASLKKQLKSKVERLADSLTRANSQNNLVTYHAETESTTSISNIADPKTRSRQISTDSSGHSGQNECCSLYEKRVLSHFDTSFFPVKHELIRLMEDIGLTPDDRAPGTSLAIDQRGLRHIFNKLGCRSCPFPADSADTVIQNETQLAVRALQVCRSAVIASFDVWSQLLPSARQSTVA